MVYQKLDDKLASEKGPTYKRAIKSIVTYALRDVFDSSFEGESAFASLSISLEYPYQPVDFPCVFISYDESKLESAGANREYESSGTSGRYQRWKYEGTVSLNILALTNYERDYLSDSLLGVLAFAKMRGDTSHFEEVLASSNYVRMSAALGKLTTLGEAVEPLPWEAPGYLYVTGYKFPVYGEFLSDVKTYSLFIEEIDEIPYLEGQEPAADNNGEWL